MPIAGYQGKNGDVAGRDHVRAGRRTGEEQMAGEGRKEKLASFMEPFM